MKKMKSGIEIDTKNLTDKDAEIHEAVQNLFKICQKYDVTAFVRIVLNQSIKSGQFIRMQTVPIHKDKVNQDYGFLINLISQWIEESTNSRLKVVLADE